MNLMAGSTAAAGQRRGADLLIDGLLANGADLVFGVPGESFIPILDAIVDAPGLRFITTRHEGGAAIMAEAYGKMTGHPGICFVTRGPGATNASIGIHTAQQDSTPLIVFIGQAALGMLEREAFQEVEFRRHFADMAKWVAQIDSAARIPEFVSRAYHTAMAGRPGAVVLAIPEDVLSEFVTAQVIPPAAKRAQPAPRPRDIAALQEILGRSARPLVIAGGGGWTKEASALLLRWAERDRLPVGCELRCQDYFDNTHPNYAGHFGFGIPPSLARRVQESDCLVLLGARMGEIPTSGYRLIDIPKPKQNLVHVHLASEELGRVYYPDLPIQSSPEAFLQAVMSATAIEPPNGRADWISGCRSDEEKSRIVPPAPGSFDLALALRILQRRLPEETVITNGAGNYANWIHKIWEFRHFRSQLAPIAGGMGYGLPAAIACAFLQPDRHVVATAGDGCFLMTGQELATAVRHKLKVLTLVVNNGMLGTIRMHQEHQYPGRVSATDLTNPDFADFARSFGAWGAVVARTEDFEAALEQALAIEGPTLLELRVDPEAIAVTRTLSQIRSGQ